MRHVGRSLSGLEDRIHVTGRGRFAGDVLFPDQLHMRIVRSHIAHGRVKAIDTSGALAVPGVVAVWTAQDVARLPPVGFRVAGSVPLEAHLQPILAGATVRYVGEPVAAVFAETSGAADDAAELVVLDVEPREPLLIGTANEPEPAESLTVRRSFGNLHTAFNEADIIVETSVSLARDGGLPLETRVTVARWDGGRDILEVWGAAKSPVFNREALAEMLDRPRASLVWHAPHVGGSFGTRGEVAAEDVLVAHAARVLERPVRWVEDRRDHLVAAAQARGFEAEARAAVGPDGTLYGIDATFRIDQGAYLRSEGSLVADLVAGLIPGPYRLPAYRVAGHMLLTNRTPAGTARGAGRAEATFLRERLLDAVATKTGVAPLEVRRRNLAGNEEMPYRRGVSVLGHEVAFENARFQSLLDQATRRFSLDVLRRRTEERRAAGDIVGIGTALSVDANAASASEDVSVAVDRKGCVEVVTGAARLGQGVETALAQIVGDILGVDYAAVRVTCGDSQRAGRSEGTWLSRTTAAVGTAAGFAAETLRERALTAGARLLDMPAGRLTILAGRVREADRHFGPTVSLGDVARALEEGELGFLGRSLAAEGRFHTGAMSFPYGLAVVVAEVDPLTGIVSVPRAFVAADVGNVVNPALAEGQFVGGAIHGLSSALFTSFDVSESGDPLRVSLADCHIPTAREAPSVEVLLAEEAPSEANPFGLKGVGEGGVGGVSAAVAAAVDDALGIPGFARALPIRPADVLAAVKRGRAGG
jgi:CO/xanthine dehydrogenase Mo-binding subunit